MRTIEPMLALVSAELQVGEGSADVTRVVVG